LGAALSNYAAAADINTGTRRPAYQPADRPPRLTGITKMNTWMVIALIWAMFAVCVVLFVRGASPKLDRKEDVRDEETHGVDASASRVKV
jgi:hypothetical protein